MKPAGLPAAPQLPPSRMEVSAGELLSDHTWEAIAVRGGDLASQELEEPRLSGVELTGLALSQVKIRHLVLEDAALSTIDAVGLRAPQAQVRRAVISGCRLTGAQLAGSEGSDLRLEECRLDYADLGGVQLQDSLLIGCDLREADLSHANLQRVRLERCDLRGADLSGAALRGCELAGCQLDGAQGLEALRGARMPSEDIIGNATIFAAALGVTAIED